jgi:hypothetical protein
MTEHPENFAVQEIYSQLTVIDSSVAEEKSSF